MLCSHVYWLFSFSISLCPTLPSRLLPVYWGYSVVIRTGLPDVLLPRNPAMRGMEFDEAHVWPGDRLPLRIGLSPASSTTCIPGVCLLPGDATTKTFSRCSWSAASLLLLHPRAPRQEDEGGNGAPLHYRHPERRLEAGGRARPQQRPPPGPIQC